MDVKEQRGFDRARALRKRKGKTSGKPGHVRVGNTHRWYCIPREIQSRIVAQEFAKSDITDFHMVQKTKNVSFLSMNPNNNNYFNCFHRHFY